MVCASCVEKCWDRYKGWRKSKVKELRRSCFSSLLLWRDTIPIATLTKESIQSGLGYSFKCLLHHQHGREHRNMYKSNGVWEGAESSTFASASSRKKEKVAGPGLGFSNPKTQWNTSSNKVTTNQMRPHLLNPPKQYHYLITKHSNIWSQRVPFLFKPPQDLSLFIYF